MLNYKFFLIFLMEFIIIIFTPFALEVTINPGNLIQGDGQPRIVSLEIESDDPGHDKIYVRDIKFVRDNAGSQSLCQVYCKGFEIKLEENNVNIKLPKPFNDFGTYIIQLECNEDLEEFQIVHQRNSGFIQTMGKWFSDMQKGFDSLVGSSFRLGESLFDSDPRDIWIGEMPSLNNKIDINNDIKCIIEEAKMPYWVRDGNIIVCSKLINSKWQITAYAIADDKTGSKMLWTWKPAFGNDYSPVYICNSGSIVFLRVINNSTDVWLLTLGSDNKPKSEKKITELGNVEDITGWFPQHGIIFRTKEYQIDKNTKIKNAFWSVSNPINESKPKLFHLAFPEQLMKGCILSRNSVIIEIIYEFTDESEFAEINKNGKQNIILSRTDFFDRRPRVSGDGKWIIFDSLHKEEEESDE